MQRHIRKVAITPLPPSTNKHQPVKPRSLNGQCGAASCVNCMRGQRAAFVSVRGTLSGDPVRPSGRRRAPLVPTRPGKPHHGPRPCPPCPEPLPSRREGGSFWGEATPRSPSTCLAGEARAGSSLREREPASEPRAGPSGREPTRAPSHRALSSCNYTHLTRSLLKTLIA